MGVRGAGDQQPATRWSRWRSCTAAGPMPASASTNSRIGGDGAALPPRTSNAARAALVPSRWFTTGGAGTAARPSQKPEDGSHHQQGAAAGCRRPSHQTCRTALMPFIANIRAALSHVRKVAEQSPSTDRWKTLLDYIVARIIPQRPRKLLKTCALLASDCGF